MSRSYFQDVAQELGFMQVEWVAGLLSIAHLFGPSKSGVASTCFILTASISMLVKLWMW